METMRIESPSDNVAMIANNVHKPKASNPHAKQSQVCSLGHSGHSNEKCYTRIRKEERELARKFKELMKKNGETAQLTSIKQSTPSSQPTSTIPPTPSYYNEAYATGNQDLTMVTLDTACTSHMFGNKIFLSRLRHAALSPIM